MLKSSNPRNEMGRGEPRLRFQIQLLNSVLDVANVRQLIDN